MDNHTKDSHNLRFDPPLALASLSGESDANWALRRRTFVGAVFLGAFNLDETTREASRRMVQRGRDEFLTAQPFELIAHQLDHLAGRCDRSLRIGVNVRASGARAIHRAARTAAQRGAILEINAHCRQREMVGVGCGQQLLRDLPRLREYVQAALEAGATVSVKGRFEVDGVDTVEVFNRLFAEGLHIAHVDAMDSEERVAELGEGFVIANNGVRDRRHVEQYRDLGADAVSVARAHQPRRLNRLRRYCRELFPGDRGGADADRSPTSPGPETNNRR